MRSRKYIKHAMLLCVIALLSMQIAKATYPDIPRSEGALGILTPGTGSSVEDINSLRRHIERLNGAALPTDATWLSMQPTNYADNDPFTTTSSYPRWNIVFSQTSTQGGGTTASPENNVMEMGWNVGPGGTKETEKRMSQRLRMEDFYEYDDGTGTIWSEFHYQINNDTPNSGPANCVGCPTSWRPIFINVDKKTGETTIGGMGSKWQWVSVDNSTLYMQLTGTQLHLLNGTDMYLNSGSQVIGLSGSSIDLQAGSNAYLSSTSSLRVGDATNNITLNANSGSPIQTFAGTARPTITIPLFTYAPYAYATMTTYSYGTNATKRHVKAFEDNTSNNLLCAMGIPVTSEWDLSSTFSIVLYVGSPTALTSKTIEFDVGMSVAGDPTDSITTPTQVFTATATSHAVSGTVAAFKAYKFNLITNQSLSGLSVGDVLNVTIERNGATAGSTTDNLVDLLYCTGANLVVYRKQM